MIKRIDTSKDLNKFVDLAGVVSPNELINKLADSEIIVSNVMAKLIMANLVKRHKLALF